MLGGSLYIPLLFERASRCYRVDAAIMSPLQEYLIASHSATKAERSARFVCTTSLLFLFELRRVL